MTQKVVIDCSTGQATYRELTADEQADHDARQAEAEAQRQRIERLQQAYERDLSNYRKLLDKLRPSSGDNLTMAEVRLIGRMVAWLWLRDEMD